MTTPHFWNRNSFGSKPFHLVKSILGELCDHQPFMEPKLFSVPSISSYSSSLWQDNSTKLNRVFVTCFNVTPDFASMFKFWKSRGASEFGIKYMEAAFNKEAGSGEFFFEFDEKIWSHKLVECFQSQGACQVMPSTFANNDRSDSASNALLHVLTSQEKTNLKYTRGTCPPALVAKVQAKKAAEALIQASSSKEFDEKTLAAMRQSLALQEETKAAVVKVEGGLESVKDGIQSQVVKLEGIEHGVCHVIPDYQKEIALLKSQLAHKTALCDRIEGQKAYQTREINKVNGEKDALTRENKRLAAQLQENIDTWTKEKFVLTEQVDLCKSIGQARQITEELTTLLYEERENKRQRGA